jgi:hypothetical protein
MEQKIKELYKEKIYWQNFAINMKEDFKNGGGFTLEELC